MEFSDKDLSASRFQRVRLTGSTFEEAYLDGVVMREVDLSGLTVRAAYLDRVRMSGVEIPDLEIYGEFRRFVVNGVDIVPLVEAELDRRMPGREQMRPRDLAGYRQAWATLERLWAGTVDRARRLPEGALHQRVDGEWSFIETLRHLGFATACWMGLATNTVAWHPLDLPWDEAPGWEGVPWDRDARPSLDEVLQVRRSRQTWVRDILNGAAERDLDREVFGTAPGWPGDGSGVPVRECLRVVVKEEWEHRVFAERDLTVLEHQHTTEDRQ